MQCNGLNHCAGSAVNIMLLDWYISLKYVYIYLYLSISVHMCVYVWISVHIINPCVSDPKLSIHGLGCTADCQSRSMLAITDWFMGYSRIWADMFMWISAQICKGVRRDTHRYSRIRTHLNGLKFPIFGDCVNITWIYVNISCISCLYPFKSCLNGVYMFKYPLLGGMGIQI